MNVEKFIERLRLLKRPKWLRKVADALASQQYRIEGLVAEVERKDKALKQALSDVARVEKLYQQMERKNARIMEVCREPMEIPLPTGLIGQPARLDIYR